MLIRSPKKRLPTWSGTLDLCTTPSERQSRTSSRLFHINLTSPKSNRYQPSLNSSWKRLNSSRAVAIYSKMAPLKILKWKTKVSRGKKVKETIKKSRLLSNNCQESPMLKSLRCNSWSSRYMMYSNSWRHRPKWRKVKTFSTSIIFHVSIHSLLRANLLSHYI